MRHAASINARGVGKLGAWLCPAHKTPGLCIDSSVTTEHADMSHCFQWSEHRHVQTRCGDGFTL
jgi:hypothetical protein